MPDALPPNFQPATENDTVPISVNLTLNLPRAQVAELGQQLTEAAAPPQPLQFASVDKVELVGILPSKNTADESLWKNLTPLAQQLVQSVEEAHNAIDSAVKMAAQQQAAQTPQPVKAMPVQAAPPMQLLNVPQSMLTHVTQVQPSCGCAQAV